MQIDIRNRDLNKVRFPAQAASSLRNIRVRSWLMPGTGGKT